MKVIVLLAVFALMSLVCCSTRKEEKNALEKRFFISSLIHVVTKPNHQIHKLISKFINFSKSTMKKFKLLEKVTKVSFVNFGNKVKRTYLDIARKISKSAKDVGDFVSKRGKNFGHFFESFGKNPIHFFIRATRVIQHIVADIFDFCRKKILPMLKRVPWEKVLKAMIPYIDSEMTIFVCQTAVTAIITAIAGPASTATGLLVKFACKAGLHLIKMGVQLIVKYYLPDKSKKSG